MPLSEQDNRELVFTTPHLLPKQFKSLQVILLVGFMLSNGTEQIFKTWKYIVLYFVAKLLLTDRKKKVYVTGKVFNWTYVFWWHLCGSNAPFCLEDCLELYWRLKILSSSKPKSFRYFWYWIVRRYKRLKNYVVSNDFSVFVTNMTE